MNPALNSFIQACSVNVGLGTNTTVLNCSNIAFVFPPRTYVRWDATGYPVRYFYANVKGTINFGTTSGGHTTQNSCFFVLAETGILNYCGLICTSPTGTMGTINLYGGAFKSMSVLPVKVTIDQGNVWNVSATFNVGVCINPSAVGYNVNAVGLTGNSNLTPADTILCMIEGQTSYALNINELTSDMTISNLIMKNNQYDAYFYHFFTYYLYLVNLSLDHEPFSPWWYRPYGPVTTGVYRQYTVALTVIDGNGNAVAGASVIIYDKNGNVVFSGSTGASGLVSTPALNYQRYIEDPSGSGVHNKSIITPYSPHKIVIRKAGFQDYTAVFTLNAQATWTIALSPPVSGGQWARMPAMNSQDLNQDLVKIPRPVFLAILDFLKAKAESYNIMVNTHKESQIVQVSRPSQKSCVIHELHSFVGPKVRIQIVGLGREKPPRGEDDS